MTKLANTAKDCDADPKVLLAIYCLRSTAGDLMLNDCRLTDWAHFRAETIEKKAFQTLESRELDRALFFCS